MTTTTVALDGSILGWGAGGISRYLRNVLEHLALTDDLEIELYANSRDPVIDIPGIVEHDIRLKGGLVWRTAVLARQIYKNKPDVFWIPSPTRPPYIPHPYVVTVHDLGPVLFPSTKSTLSNVWFATSYRRAVTRADHVIAPSEATARDLREVWALSEDHISVVPHGVSRLFSPGDREAAKRHVSEHFGLERPFCLVVGTIEARKGLDVVVDVAVADPGSLIVFAGRPGFGHEPVMSRGHAAGAIFLGEVTDAHLVELYRAAEMLLLPSVYEGFGLSALEAMACGCPAVTAARAGSLDEFYRDGARSVSERSSEAWIEAMRDVAANRNAWVAKGLELASQHTWDRTAAATARILTSVSVSRPAAGIA